MRARIEWARNIENVDNHSGFPDNDQAPKVRVDRAGALAFIVPRSSFSISFTLSPLRSNALPGRCSEWNHKVIRFGTVVPSWPEVVFAFHSKDEIGPKMRAGPTICSAAFCAALKA
jgi:hypothetical protein